MNGGEFNVKTELAFLFLLAGISLGAGAEIPSPSGEFLFDGKHPYVGSATISNVTVRGKALYFNGKYSTDYWGDDKKHVGYTAVFRPLNLIFEKFTVAVKLRPEDISGSKKTLLVGGASSRWLALSLAETNRLELSLNNQRFRHVIDLVIITNGAWVTLATSFDLEARKIIVYVNGLRADEIQLPADFTLDIISDEKFREYDKVWTFTNYSDAGTFQGMVAGLLSFNSVLSDDEVKKLFPNN
jgi:hypothetical protein